MFSFPRIYTVIVYASLVLCHRLQNNFLDSPPRGYAIYPDEAQVYIAPPGQCRFLHYSTLLQLRIVPASPTRHGWPLIVVYFARLGLIGLSNAPAFSKALRRMASQRGLRFEGHRHRH